MGAREKTLSKWVRNLTGGLAFILLCYFVSRKPAGSSATSELHGQRMRAVPMNIPRVEDPGAGFKVVSNADKGWLMETAPAGFTGGSHVVQFLPGAIRGNHFHEVIGEAMVFFGGTVLLRVQNFTQAGLPLSPPVDFIIKSPEEGTGAGFQRFYLPPFTAHAVKNIDEQGRTAYLVSTLTAAVARSDIDDSTRKINLIT